MNAVATGGHHATGEAGGRQLDQEVAVALEHDVFVVDEEMPAARDAQAIGSGLEGLEAKTTVMAGQDVAPGHHVGATQLDLRCSDRFTVMLDLPGQHQSALELEVAIDLGIVLRHGDACLGPARAFRCLGEDPPVPGRQLGDLIVAAVVDRPLPPPAVVIMGFHPDAGELGEVEAEDLTGDPAAGRQDDLEVADIAVAQLDLLGWLGGDPARLLDRQTVVAPQRGAGTRSAPGRR